MFDRFLSTPFPANENGTNLSMRGQYTQFFMEILSMLTQSVPSIDWLPAAAGGGLAALFEHDNFAGEYLDVDG
jgi:hypothetical protein